MNIDIIRTSASRPNLLKISTESILKNLKFSGKINWFLHEDVLNASASNECIKYSNFLNLYKDIKSDSPPLGHTRSFYWLTDKITSPYFIYWEDDYELLNVFYCNNCKRTTNKYKHDNIDICKKCGNNLIELENNLDILLNLMENNKNINQISFPKRDIMPDKPNFIKKEIKIDGIPLVVSNHWYVSPGIWRTSFIMPYIEKLKKYYYPKTKGGFGWHWEINNLLKSNDKKYDTDWIEQNLGHFYLGKIRQGQRIYHLGNNENSLRNNNYKW